MIKILLLFFFSSCFAFTDREKRAWVNHNDRCTAFIVDPKGSADGATMTTHTNDCYNCDFRLARVPAQDWPEGSMKAIYEYRIAYPRYVGYDRGQVYWPQHTEGSYPWNITKPIGYIPQVPHTYAYLEGTYGLLNEYQVGMGESTCSAKIWSAPVSAGGGALMDISALSRLAMERCQTARCAVKTMGGLAEQYGFYGSAWTGDEAERFLEAGEAMTVSDPTEAWVFHILPDPTGKSAVWAAQRLQEGHFAIVANEFVIKEMDLDDPEYYLASKNILDVAKEKGFWDPSSGQPFNFKGAYMKGHPFKRYCQRRHWRGLSTAAPSLNLDGETDQMELPFSVKVDKPLTKEDFFRLLRDHYEGTPYDMTQGLSSGPYGNPNRYDMGTGSGTPIEVVYKGSFERAISIFRAQYSYVTVSRASLPNEIGAVMWFGHYAPHATVFVPFYVGSELPKAFQVGSLYQLNRQSSFWAFCLIGNWLEKYYKFIIVDIQAYQKLAETASSQAQEKFESIALALYNQNNIGATKAVLQEWSAPYAAEVVDKAWDFLDYLIVRYHDGYKFENLEVEFLNPTKLFYPFWWLEQVGYFNPNGSHVPAYMHDDPASMLPSTPVAPTPPPPYHEEHNHPSSPTNAPTPSHTAPTTLAAIPQAIPQSESAAFGFFTIALTAIVCLVVGVHLGSKYGHAFGYQAINEKYDD